MANEYVNIGQAWLDDRWRPGNWIEITPEEEIPPSIEGSNRTIINMFQMVFTPEIKRRQRLGVLEPDFFVQSAQLIQPTDGTQIIRFNNEVRGVLRVKIDRPIEKGESLTLGDLENLDTFDVIEEELDCGHYTMFWTGRSWATVFDFRSGRAKSTEFLGLASQFLMAAKFSTEQGHPGPAIDNLYSACELASKAELILNRDPAASAKTHAPLQSAINAWGKLGNVETNFLTLFNRLSNMRTRARYEAGTELRLPTLDEISIATKQIEGLQECVRHLG